MKKHKNLSEWLMKRNLSEISARALVLASQYSTGSRNTMSPNHYNNDWKIGEFLYEQQVPFFEACIIKYVLRYRKKEGRKDLLKAKDYLDKLLELYEGDHRGSTDETSKPRPPYLRYRGGYFDMDSLPPDVKKSYESGVSRAVSGDPSGRVRRDEIFAKGEVE
jgi:hypothetical protein